ncbi:hypothetical protein CALVIDRAFT_314078 [Calocera viscosa TUFC12733]|uniref:Uncharacterized protein n=1 Tax=Calocera viscosa (strain TUFC12733) TaxID=1330018 RepID=A0A167I0G4_CALVF|nr:hypothetical protein CALVIDRAFT_314078 [Calocera viscosa TUFC12733]
MCTHRTGPFTILDFPVRLRSFKATRQPSATRPPQWFACPSGLYSLLIFNPLSFHLHPPSPGNIFPQSSFQALQSKYSYATTTMTFSSPSMRAVRCIVSHTRGISVCITLGRRIVPGGRCLRRALE